MSLGDSDSFLHRHMFLVGIGLALLALIVALFFTKKTYAPTSSCLEQTGAELQTCCTDWARTNEMMIPACTGSWYLQEGMCAYQCTAPSAL